MKKQKEFVLTIIQNNVNLKSRYKKYDSGLGVKADEIQFPMLLAYSRTSIEKYVSITLNANARDAIDE